LFAVLLWTDAPLGVGLSAFFWTDENVCFSPTQKINLFLEREIKKIITSKEGMKQQ
jgi:hypothetical protein